MKTLTMSISDFYRVQNNELTYEDLYNRKFNHAHIEKCAGYILKNPCLKRVTITFIASINFLSMQYVAHADEISNATAALSNAQGKIVTVMQASISTIVVISALFDLAKSTLGRESSDALSIVLKYAFIEIAALATPKFFSMLRELFY